MKIQDIMAILGVAAATMAFTLVFAGPEQVDAVDQEANAATRITPIISQPTLTIAGLEIKLAMDKPDYAAGDKPVVTIETTNPTDKRVETNLWVGMTSSSLLSRMSRAPTMPNYLWSESIPLTLEPGETKQFQFTTEKELVAGNTVSVTMSNTDQKAAFAKMLNLRRGAQRVPNTESVVTRNRDAIGIDGR